MLRPRQLVAVLGLSLLTTAFGSGLALAARTVHVDLVDKADGGMAVTTSAESVKAGKVTFDVTNTSHDIEHEFLIAKLKVAPDKIPYDDNKGIVKEAALHGVTELGDLAPGKSGTMTMDLTAGKYLMFCNMPGHFKEGMYHVLTVTK